MNLDSGDIQAAAPSVWPNDLMDVCDLLENISPDDWTQLAEDMRDDFVRTHLISMTLCHEKKKTVLRPFQFLFSQKQQHVTLGFWRVIKFQFQTFLGLHDFFDDPIRLGFLAG